MTAILGLATATALGLLVVLVAGTRTRHQVPMVTAFIVHGAAAILIYTLLGLYAPDARTYDLQAQWILDYWTGNGPEPTVNAGKEGFPIVLAALYAAVGESYPPLGLVLNVTVCALVVPIVGATAERLGSPGKTAAWLAALFPPLIFWGSLLLRESLSWLCVSVVVWALAGLQERTRHREVVALCVAISALFWVRGTAAVLVAAAGLLALIITRRRLGVIASGALLVGLVVVGPLADRFLSITGTYDLAQVNRSRAQLSTTADSGFAVVSYSDPMAVISALPNVVPRAFFGPFPWEWAALNPMLILDGLAWLLVMFWTWRAWKRMDKRKAFLAVGPALTIALALAITSGNYGTMQRLRMMPLVMLIPVAAAGVARVQERRTSGRPGERVRNV